MNYVLQISSYLFIRYELHLTNFFVYRSVHPFLLFPCDTFSYYQITLKLIRTHIFICDSILHTYKSYLPKYSSIIKNLCVLFSLFRLSLLELCESSYRARQVFSIQCASRVIYIYIYKYNNNTRVIRDIQTTTIYSHKESITA